MTDKNNDPAIRFGITGLGGYAWNIAELIHRRSDLATLVAFSEPDAARRATRAATLKEWNVPVFERFEQLLATRIEAVWLPLPIGLHSAFLAQALAAGKAVVCEKPAAATVQEVDAMIAARDRTKKPAIIGYQHLADPAILSLKRRLIAGELGAIRAARIMGCWPRPVSYYTRNNWAGRKRIGDSHIGETWILDSPLSNAMSHFLQLALYLIGPAEERTAEAAEVQAELYRANDIENFDTCSVRVTTEQNVDLLVLMTHASTEFVQVSIEIIGEKGSVVVHPEQHIQWNGPGGQETISLSKMPGDGLLEGFCRMLRNQPAKCALASLEIARAPVVVVNCVAEAAPVRSVKAEAQKIKDNTDVQNAIPGISAVLRRCAAEGKMIHESGLAPWSSPAGSKSARGYRQFTKPA